jgi:hypothetical protein
MESLSQPCKEAYQIDGFVTDERTVKDPSKLQCDDKDTWYTKGLNHRVIKGHIFRDFPAKLWVVDIDSLEDLNKFSHKYGSLIFDEENIEIYDDYRE